MLTAKQIIEILGMQPLVPEGGYIKVLDSSGFIIKKENLPERYTSDKPVCSTILYLITKDTFSRMHRLPTDEIYHFYMGDAVEQLQLFEDGTGKTVRLGHDLANGELVQSVAPASCWQGSKLAEGGEYALMGTTMAPAYTDDDYTDGVKEYLVKKYPMFEHEIMERL
jgi:predicted cupin superfamily sugar epimerase